MYKLKKEMNQLIPYSIGILFTPEEDLKKLSTNALNHRIRYLRELILISHKNGYKPPKNIVEELNELINAKVEGLLQLKEKERKERRSDDIMGIFGISFIGALPLMLVLLLYSTEAAYGAANNLSMGFMLGISIMFFILMTGFAIKSYLEAH